MCLVVSHKANPEEARNFETANRYHFFHTFALFGVPFCRFPRVVSIFLTFSTLNVMLKYIFKYLQTGALFISGTLIFCGTCYYNGLTADKTYNKFTPTGGMLLIAAWLSMIL